MSRRLGAEEEEEEVAAFTLTGEREEEDDDDDNDDDGACATALLLLSGGVSTSCSAERMQSTRASRSLASGKKVCRSWREMRVRHVTISVPATRISYTTGLAQRQIDTLATAMCALSAGNGVEEEEDEEEDEGRGEGSGGDNTGSASWSAKIFSSKMSGGRFADAERCCAEDDDLEEEEDEGLLMERTLAETGRDALARADDW